ncbi:MAG: hypothetical protein HOP29_05415 [Phycisphaerales bacterium]|nr:hypothetical protein [Phycisphaerales bacterium]
MTIEPLREALSERPFRPFKLQLGDGTEVAVSHPECVAFHPKSLRTILVAMPDGGYKAIDLFLVAALHKPNGRTSPPRRRRR